MSEHTSRGRPAPASRDIPRGHKPGGFRVSSNPSPHYTVTITVDYNASATRDAINAAMSDVLATTRDELERRGLV